jgi:hypothetical protein
MIGNGSNKGPFAFRLRILLVYDAKTFIEQANMRKLIPIAFDVLR